jgi:hypothetical protein
MQQPITLSTTQLIKYTVFSVIFATVILLTVILPAEYNIDLTGIGNKLGLTVFHQVNEEVTTPEPSVISKLSDLEKSKNTMETIEVIVPPGRGVEYKFVMTQYQKLNYQWITDGSALYFDLHGEPEGDTTGYFESYAIATLREMTGSFTAPFAGLHGWYWKNTTDSPVVVQLVVSGEYATHSLK